MDADELENALRSLLGQHPDALVGAIDESGLFVPPPPGLPIGGHRVSRARSALDLVQPAEAGAVADLWERTKAVGEAHATVAVAGDADAIGSLHVFDLRPGHDVFICVLVGIDIDLDHFDEVAELPAPRPRLVRTVKDPVAVVLYADDDLTPMLGWEPSEYVGKRSLDFVHPDDQKVVVDTWMQVLSKPGTTCRARVRHQRRDGSWMWVEIANRAIAGHPDGAVESEIFDISEEMEAQEEVRAREQLLLRLAAVLPVGVLHLDVDQAVVYANDRLFEIMGCEPSTHQNAMLDGVVDRDGLMAAIRRVMAGHDDDIGLEIDCLDGTGRRSCTLALRALTTPAGEVTGAVGCLTDVTEAVRMRAELEQRATHDDLTGCVNRATAVATLERALARPGPGTAAIFVDLDGFKDVNDRHGHVIGDEVLVAVAGRFRQAVREGDVVGRVGGDEFLVVCAPVTSSADAMTLGERISRALDVAVEAGGHHLQSRASIGVAWSPGDGDRSTTAADSLIAAADAAMYASKADGRGRPVVVGPDDR